MGPREGSAAHSWYQRVCGTSELVPLPSPPTPLRKPTDSLCESRWVSNQAADSPVRHVSCSVSKWGSSFCPIPLHWPSHPGSSTIPLSISHLMVTSHHHLFQLVIKKQLSGRHLWLLRLPCPSTASCHRPTGPACGMHRFRTAQRPHCPPRRLPASSSVSPLLPCLGSLVHWQPEGSSGGSLLPPAVFHTLGTNPDS